MLLPRKTLVVTYPDLNEGQAAGEEQGHVDRVRRNTRSRLNLGQEAVEGEALITSECEDLARGCRYLVDCTEEIHEYHNKDQYDGCWSRTGDSQDDCDPTKQNDKVSKVL